MGKNILYLVAVLTISACTAPSSQAICDGTASARTEHAAALASDGGPLSMVTGARLVMMLDKGCGE